MGRPTPQPYISKTAVDHHKVGYENCIVNILFLKFNCAGIKKKNKINIHDTVLVFSGF